MPKRNLIYKGNGQDEKLGKYRIYSEYAHTWPVSYP
jgi:hypothetical protein